MGTFSSYFKNFVSKFFKNIKQIFDLFDFRNLLNQLKGIDADITTKKAFQVTFSKHTIEILQEKDQTQSQFLLNT